MDPVIGTLIPSIAGGLVIAFLIARFRWGSSDVLSGPPIEQSTPTDEINMAHIRAAGVGGLGLLAMALVVAWFVPRIGQTLVVGGVLGLGLGIALILRRRRAGPLPSSSGTAGANNVLSIDQPAASEAQDEQDGSNRLHVAEAGRLA
jgi:hypothetical protein